MSESLSADAIAEIAELARKAENASAIQQVIDLPTGEKHVLMKDGSNHVIGQPTRDGHGLTLIAPVRTRGKFLIQTVDSMVEYLERFKGEGTTLFANITTNRIVAVLDFHKNPESAGFNEHYAVLDLPYSEEWKIWQAANGKMVDQLTFARFIEENGSDLVVPSGADLIEVCRDLQAVRKVNFIKAVRTNSDTENFEFSDNTELKASSGSVEVPTKFQLKLPVYFDGRYVDQFAFLRWKLDDGALNLGIALHRHEHVRQATFRELVTDIATRAGVPVIYGSSTASISL